MNENEKPEWWKDFRTKFPAMSAKVSQLLSKDEAIRIEWNDALFLRPEYVLDDFLRANRELWRQDKPWFVVDDVPRAILKLVSKYHAERQEKVAKLASEHWRGAEKTVREDSVMTPMLSHVEGKAKAYRREHGEKAPHALFDKWADEASKEFDDTDDDLEDQPRYRCLDCFDTGYTTFQARRKKSQTWVAYTGACRCDTGQRKNLEHGNNGRYLGYPPSGSDLRWTDGSDVPENTGEDNQFNDALSTFGLLGLAALSWGASML